MMNMIAIISSIKDLNNLHEHNYNDIITVTLRISPIEKVPDSI